VFRFAWFSISIHLRPTGIHDAATEIDNEGYA
jgi:hypothetical protein